MSIPPKTNHPSLNPAGPAVPASLKARPIGRLAEIQSKNKKRILAHIGATTRLRGHARASTQRRQAKRDNRE